MNIKVQRTDWLLHGLLALYLAASLLHFTHNAEYVRDYPNLPEWMTRSVVYLTWLGITAFGALGYVLYRFRLYVMGLPVLAIYAAAGLDGLLHYTRAPMAAHTHAMNLTVLFEVSVASVLLVYILFIAKARFVEWKR
jgi:hypothetical protein